MARGAKTGGRQKGTPNKNTGAVKDMILTALSEAGGHAYLLKQAQENPNAFMTLLGKVVPMQIGGDANNPIEHLVREVRLVAPK